MRSLEIQEFEYHILSFLFYDFKGFGI